MSANRNAKLAASMVGVPHQIHAPAFRASIHCGSNHLNLRTIRNTFVRDLPNLPATRSHAEITRAATKQAFAFATRVTRRTRTVFAYPSAPSNAPTARARRLISARATTVSRCGTTNSATRFAKGAARTAIASARMNAFVTKVSYRTPTIIQVRNASQCVLATAADTANVSSTTATTTNVSVTSDGQDGIVIN